MVENLDQRWKLGTILANQSVLQAEGKEEINSTSLHMLIILPHLLPSFLSLIFLYSSFNVLFSRFESDSSWWYLIHWTDRRVCVSKISKRIIKFIRASIWKQNMVQRILRKGKRIWEGKSDLTLLLLIILPHKLLLLYKKG